MLGTPKFQCFEVIGNGNLYYWQALIRILSLGGGGRGNQPSTYICMYIYTYVEYTAPIGRSGDMLHPPQEFYVRRSFEGPEKLWVFTFYCSIRTKVDILCFFLEEGIIFWVFFEC